jgi:hypothetical protein
MWNFAPTISTCQKLLDEYWGKKKGAKFCTEYVTTDECVVAAWYSYLHFTMVVLEEHQHQNTIL